MMPFVEQLIIPVFSAGDNRQKLNPEATINAVAEIAKKVRGAILITVSKSNKSSYRNN